MNFGSYDFMRQKIGSVFSRIKKDDLNYFEEQFMYGHREIVLHHLISKGCEISKHSYLQAGLAHGWAPNFEVWRLRKRNLKRANRYVWKSPNFTSENSIYNQIPIGAPWLYLLCTLGISPGNKIELPIKNSRRNLIMPFHSEGFRLKKINQQAEHFSKTVDPSESTVCLFWLDYCDPANRKAYTDLGFVVECVGYPNRVKDSFMIGGPRTFFLINLLSLMLEHRTVIIDSPSTSLFYAASLGKDIILVEDEISKNFVNIVDSSVKKIHKKDLGSNSEWLNKNSEYTKNGSDNHKDLNLKAWIELGYKHIKGVDDLMNLDWKTNKEIPDHIEEFGNKLTESFSNMTIKSIN